MAQPAYLSSSLKDSYAPLQIRRSNERGHVNQGWLDSFHTFSFGDYFDPNFVGFRHLRVINEDRIQEGQGFPSHPHRNMEIITYVVEGELAHRDSMGNSSIIRSSEFQKMSAGRGVTHSEFNHSLKVPVHLFQIWIVPEIRGGHPSYEQRMFSRESRTGNLKLIASKNGYAGSLHIQQDVNLYSCILNPGQTIEDRLMPNRYGWFQVVSGILSINGQIVNAGDGVSLLSGGMIELTAPLHGSSAEVLFFDLA